MGAHSWEDLKNPFMFAAMATVGCFVGHIFMYPLGLFELSGQAGAALSNLFNPSAAASFMDPATFTEMATPVATDATPFIDQTASAEIAHSGYDPGPDGVFSKGEAGFEDCVSSGGGTHFHGTDLVCHPTHD